MDIVEKARHEIHTFERPSKVTSETLVEEIERLRAEVESLKREVNQLNSPVILSEWQQLEAENEALKNYLRMIEHATAPTLDDDGYPTTLDDGGYHETAYTLAQAALRGEGE